MSKALSKYNVQLKTRVKVPASGKWVADVVVHKRDGRVLEVAVAPSAKVTETAAKVMVAKTQQVPPYSVSFSPSGE